MATENKRQVTTISAGEDLNASAFEYHAIALDDGKLATDGLEAGGILLNKPKTGEALALGYLGEMKYAAGQAIAAGARITVTASGWFTPCLSGGYAVGRAKSAATSGSLATGFFNFTVSAIKVTSWAL